MNGNNGNVLDRCEVDKIMENVYAKLKIRPKNVEVASGSNKGDGYMSFLTRVDVTTENGKELHIVMKCAPRTGELRKIAPMHEIFLREMYFYDGVVPAFRRFQTETFAVKEPFNATAKYYHSCKDDGAEALVMENIRENGFQLWDRMKLMDHQHIALVLQTYGKFHAVSYAMERHDPQTYASLKENLKDILTLETIDPSMFGMFTNCLENVQQLFKDDSPNIYNKVKELDALVVWQQSQQDHGEYPVIVHGDCWCNNMMFKYANVENPLQPTDICLLDFQITKIGSPVMDLSYFFYVSAPKQMLEKLDTYLHIYHDSLNSSLKEMNCEEVMSFEELKKEWKKFARFGYMMTLVVSRIMMSEQDEILDFTTLSPENNAFGDAFKKEMKNDGIVNAKLKTLTEHMVQNGCL